QIFAWKKYSIHNLALLVMMDYLNQKENKDLIIQTMTINNMTADELKDKIKNYNQSFQRLMQRKEVKQIEKGYARKLEITYNEERDDYHQHINVMIEVDKNYFNNSWSYIKRDRWLEL